MKLKIGYFPLSDNLSHPGDRRRLVHFAIKNGYELVLNPTSNVDLVVMSERANFGKVIRSFPNTPIILDLIDGYLEKETVTKDLLRGYSKILIGDLQSLPRSFSSIIRETCSKVQAVICSSPEQLKIIQSFNQNVHIILDNHDEFKFRSYKNYGTERRSNLIWEGMPFTLDGFKQISESLSSYLADQALSLNIITDLKYKKYLGKFKDIETQDLLSKIFFDQTTQIILQPWSIHRLEIESQKALFGILPVDTSNPIQFLKPENRLLIMWRLGLPAIASNTPAYTRVNKSIGVSIIASSLSNWVDMISLMHKQSEYAQFTLEKGQDYLREFHNYEIFDAAWHRAIGSVL